MDTDLRFWGQVTSKEPGLHQANPVNQRRATKESVVLAMAARTAGVISTPIDIDGADSITLAIDVPLIYSPANGLELTFCWYRPYTGKYQQIGTRLYIAEAGVHSITIPLAWAKKAELKKGYVKINQANADPICYEVRALVVWTEVQQP